MTPRLECNDDNNIQHNDGDDVIMEVVLMLTVIQILNLSFDPSTGLKRRCPNLHTICPLSSSHRFNLSPVIEDAH